MKKEIVDPLPPAAEVKLLLAGWCRQRILPKTIMDVEHSHQFWQIDLCEKGNASVKVGDCRFNCQPGDIVIISPGLSHRFQYPAGQQFVCWSFKFEYPVTSSPQIVPVCDDEERAERIIIIEAIAQICRGIFPEKLLNSRQCFAVTGENIAIDMLGSMIRNIVERWFLEQKIPGNGNLADTVSEYVYRRGGASVSVTELAEYLGYSSGHLRVLSRKICGRSTKNLIDQARIKVAKRMLLYSDMRINELSDLMGFADEKYFSRFFRKYVGMPPREYVKSQLDSRENIFSKR